MGDLRNVAFGTGGAFCLTQAAFVNSERFTNGLFRSRKRFLFNTACFREQWAICEWRISEPKGAFCLTQAAFVNSGRFTKCGFRNRRRFLFNKSGFRKQPPALGIVPFVNKMLFLVTNSVFRKQRAIYKMRLS